MKMGIRTLKLPYPRQRGNGWGGILRRIGMMAKPLLRSALRSSKPIAKRMAKDLARQGLEMSAQTMGDMIGGVPPGEAIRNNVQENLSQAGQTVSRGARRMAKSGFQAARKTYKRKSQSGSGAKSKKRKTSTKKKKKRKKKSPYDNIF